MTEIDDELARIWIEGDIMYAYYKVDNIELEGAREMIAKRISICNGVSYPCLIDAAKVKTISKEAREAFASGDGIKYMTACALLVGSPVNRLLGNFFLSVSKPSIPTKLFTSKEDALSWIESIVAKKTD